MPPRDVPFPSLRRLLREQTRSAHAALDRTVGAVADETEYRRYLRGLYAFRAPVEVAMGEARAPGDLGDWRLAPIAKLIGEDLDDLGEPRPAAIPWTGAPSPSQTAGILYVLEGAAIGANLLRARAARLGFDAAHGARHLARPEQAGRWADFVARLDGGRGEIAAKGALEGALGAFEHAARAFAEAGAR